MIDIRIDTSSLTCTQFLIPELSSEFVEGADAPTIRLEPGMYGFQQMSGSVANFRFEVTPDGLIDYDVANEEFLDGRGTTTLTVRGFTITLDGTPLSHDLLPTVVGASILPRDRTHVLTLVPAKLYGFLPSSQFVADFRFEVTTDGKVDYQESNDAFLSGRGSSTLRVGGFPVTIDGTALSHDLQPYALLYGNEEILSRDRTHVLTLVPAKLYGFLPSSQFAADFRFDVTVNGEVVVDRRYAGFAAASGRTLAIRGYRVTIDGRDLSYHLVPVALLGNADLLSRDRTHELTLVPAFGGYTFLATDGSGNLFALTLDIDGTVSVSPAGTGGFVAQTHDPLVRTPATIVGSPTPVELPDVLANVANQLSFDPNTGWPPQLPPTTASVDVRPSAVSFTFADWEHYLTVALANSEVKRLALQRHLTYCLA